MGGPFGGFNINPFDNRSSLGGGLLFGLPGLALAGKNQTNDAINGRLVNPGSPPGLLDPNDIGQPPVGGSAYARMQHQQNALGAQRAQEQATAASSGDAAQARSALAQRGGVSSGASERIGMAGMADQANSRQLAAGDLQRANLTGDMADEALRRSSYNQIRMQNQNMQGQLYGANSMANATLEANRPKGMFGLNLGPF